MLKWLENKIMAWAMGKILEKQMFDEDKLMNSMTGIIPGKKDPIENHITYWTGLRTALGSDAGKFIMYRIQLIYNGLHNNLRRLDLSKASNREILPMQAAQVQKLYEVLSLRDKATTRILILQARLAAYKGNSDIYEEVLAQTADLHETPLQVWQTPPAVDSGRPAQ